MWWCWTSSQVTRQIEREQNMNDVKKGVACYLKPFLSISHISLFLQAALKTRNRASRSGRAIVTGQARFTWTWSPGRMTANPNTACKPLQKEQGGTIKFPPCVCESWGSRGEFRAKAASRPWKPAVRNLNRNTEKTCANRWSFGFVVTAKVKNFKHLQKNAWK